MSTRTLPALEVGGVYGARVIALADGGRVRLDLCGTELVAQCRTSLTAGEMVEVEVDRLFPEVVLRVRRRAGVPRGVTR